MLVAYLAAEVIEYRRFKLRCKLLPQIQTKRLGKYNKALLGLRDDLIARLDAECRQWKLRWPCVVLTIILGLTLGATLLISAFHDLPRV